MIDELTPVEEIAALVSEALGAAAIDAVLSGGAVVSIYSDNEYESYDLDFITSHSHAEIGRALAALGFARAPGRHFVHPRTRFIVEFPPAPVMVGEQLVTDFAEWKTPAGTIRLLTPTDAVKDRLSAFFHWSDRQALEQAVAIACRQPIDLADIKRWATREPGPSREKFDVFENRMRQRQSGAS